MTQQELTAEGMILQIIREAREYEKAMDKRAVKLDLQAILFHAKSDLSAYVAQEVEKEITRRTHHIDHRSIPSPCVSCCLFSDCLKTFGLNVLSKDKGHKQCIF